MDNQTQKYFETNAISNGNTIRDILPVIDYSGDFLEIRGKDVIAAQIRNLLMTPRGLYPFDPEYGSDLYKQLFENMTDATEKNIFYEVKNRVLMYISGVDVLSVDIQWSKQHKSCKVDVYYYVTSEHNKTKLSLNIQNLINNKMYSALDGSEYEDYKF